MKISIVSAVSDNNVIGKNNKMLWSLPADIKFFKNLTLNKVVIMGRKTYESIGEPLKNRVNVVLTSNKSFEAPGCIVLNSIDEVLERFKDSEEVFVIGGAEIFKIFLDIADRIYLTQVHENFDGDTYFPEIDGKHWKLVSKQIFKSDHNNKFDYYFILYEKNSL